VCIWFVLLFPVIHDNILKENFYVLTAGDGVNGRISVTSLGVYFMCCFLKYINKYFLKKFIFHTSILERSKTQKII
jgi:hypothetical protein